MGEVKAIIWVNRINEMLNFPVPQSQISKNTCIIVPDNALSKDTIFIHLLIILPEMFKNHSFISTSFGFSEEELRLPELKGQFTENS
jgi:hypothetical protein